MSGFSNRIFGQKVPSDVKEIFDDLQDGKKTVNPLDPLQPSKVSHHLGESLPFVRMWAAVDVRVSGSADEDAQIRVFSVNDNREASYSNNPLDSLTTDMGSGNVKYVKQLSEKKFGDTRVDGNPYLKPPAGITSMTSKTEGVIGALQRTTVQFIVHNKQDFDNIFLPYFLRPGSTVCVDFGRTFDPNFQLYDPLEQLSNQDTEMTQFDHFIYNDEDGYLKRHDGYVKTEIGNVTKYSSNITSDGSFECSLEIVSRNTALIDKDIPNDSNLKYIFNNIFDELLVALLKSYSGNVEAIANIDEMLSRKDVYGSLDFNEETAKFFKATEINAGDGGKISDFASRVGIFHQDLSKLSRGFTEKTEIVGKEKTYITLGRLEDIFLNVFVTGLVHSLDGAEGEESKIFQKDRDNNYEIQYDSRLGLCRWDPDLFAIQTATISPVDDLPSFILPNDWDDSYNARLDPNYAPIKYPGDSDFIGPAFEVAEKDDEFYNLKTGSNTKDSRYPGIRVMPIRELFISTEIIKSSFAGAKTVEEALTKILGQINTDSNNVWNLRLSTANNSKTTFCVHDTNLMGPRPDLIFDVTSDKSIVQDCNLKFVEPKGGLGSMIAISNMSNQTYIDQHFQGNLAHLNALNRPILSDGSPISDQFVRIKSLPYKGDYNRNEHVNPAIGVDKSKLKNLIINSAKTDEQLNIVENYHWNNYIKAKRKKLKDFDDSLIFRTVGELTTEDRDEDKGSEKDLQPGVQLSNSERNLLLDNVRRRMFGSSEGGTVAPILPLELDVTIYGNNWLHPGDCFNINYLPAFYKNRVMFQILEVEHKIESSGWTTSYTSVMKLLPKYKDIVYGKVHVNAPMLQFAADDGIYEDELKDTLPPEKDQGVTDWHTVDGDRRKLARKTMSKAGTTIVYKGIGSPLQFDVRRSKIGMWSEEHPALKKLTSREKGKLTWFDNTMSDFQKYYHAEDIAYSYALRQSMFDIFKNIKNAEFDGENYTDMPGDKWAHYAYKTANFNGGLMAVMDVSSDGKMKEFIELHDRKDHASWKLDPDQKKLIDQLNMMLKHHAIPKAALKKVTKNKGFVDKLEDWSYDDHKLPRLVNNYAFKIGIRKNNDDGETENMLTFKLIDGNDIHNFTVLTIPETPFIKGDINIQSWIKNLNLNYSLFLQAVENHTQISLRYQRAAGTIGYK